MLKLPPEHKRWLCRKERFEHWLDVIIDPHIREGMAQFFYAAMAEDHLQEDQRRETAVGARVVGKKAPGSRCRQPTLLEDHGQPAAIETQLELACVARHSRSRQPFFQRRSDVLEEARQIVHTHIPGIGWLCTAGQL